MIMAKATTSKLRDALGHAAENYGAVEGKRRILEGLKSGGLHSFGFRKHSNKLIPIPVKFWQDKPVDHPIDYGGLPYRQVYIDWAEDSARWDWNDDDAMFGIQLAEEDFVKLLPPDDGDGTLAKVWAPRVARDLKRAGKLDQVTYKTELAKLIVAAGDDKAGTDYIRDSLVKWDLWPISKIKI
jgi:hypothetical protein